MIRLFGGNLVSRNYTYCSFEVVGFRILFAGIELEGSCGAVTLKGRGFSITTPSGVIKMECLTLKEHVLLYTLTSKASNTYYISEYVGTDTPTSPLFYGFFPGPADLSHHWFPFRLRLRFAGTVWCCTLSHTLRGSTGCRPHSTQRGAGRRPRSAETCPALQTRASRLPGARAAGPRSKAAPALPPAWGASTGTGTRAAAGTRTCRFGGGGLGFDQEAGCGKEGTGLWERGHQFRLRSDRRTAHTAKRPGRTLPVRLADSARAWLFERSERKW